jgi:hypothetical protein
VAFDSAAQIQSQITSTTNATSQWFTTTFLVGTPARGLPLTLNLLYAATSAALGTANCIIQASGDGTNGIVTIGQFPQVITNATGTALSTTTGVEYTLNASSPRQGYIRAILQLTGASPGHNAVWSVKIGSSNPA